MTHAISAADANREFSRVLRDVRDGRTYTVTSHGRPVARIVPVSDADVTRRQARGALLGRLEAARPRSIGAWTREELYRRDGGTDR